LFSIAYLLSLDRAFTPCYPIVQFKVS